MSVLKKAENLQQIRKVCRPTPLKGEELDHFFVETDQGRDPYQRTRERLSAALEMDEDVHLLFYGHRGCGKSTELNKFIAEQGGLYLPVNFSVHQEMSPVAIRAEDLVLVIADRVLNAAQEAGLKVKDQYLAPVLQYFSETTETQKISRDTTGEVGGGVETKDSLLGKLAGLFAKLRMDIKLNVHGEETRVSRLRKRPADLLAQVNLLIGAVRDALEGGQRLLIIVEDLDKLDIQKAREIYVNNVSLLTGIQTSIIYTIPVFLFHSPEVNAFKHNFNNVIPLPMIKVTEPGGNRTQGFETVKEIICRRIDENLIETSALELVIEKTGGVLRHVFEVLQTTALMANAETPIRTEHIEYGLKQLQKEFWQQITLPYDNLPGGPESVDDLYDRLAEYGRKQQNGEKNPPKSDAKNQILLRSCALVEYNGEGWFGVHPLVMENLKTLGRL